MRDWRNLGFVVGGREEREEIEEDRTQTRSQRDKNDACSRPGKSSVDRPVDWWTRPVDRPVDRCARRARTWPGRPPDRPWQRSGRPPGRPTESSCSRLVPVDRALSRPAACAVLAPFDFGSLCYLPLSPLSPLSLQYSGNFSGIGEDQGIEERI